MLATSRRIFGAATVVLAALLAFAPAAPAATTQIAGGKTVLRLSQGLFKQLKRNDVDVLRSQAGRVRGRVATVPVKEGALDPTTGQGTVGYEGGIRFRADGEQAALSGLFLDTARRVLRGRIAGRKVRIATAGGLSAQRDGFGSRIEVDRLRLSGAAARVLNGRLGLDRVFKAGRSLGRLSTSAQPASLYATGGNLSLSLDEGTVATLKSLAVEIRPFEAATVVGQTPLAYSFPLLRGDFSPNLASGGIGSETGLRLSQDEGASVLSVVAVGASFESGYFSAGVSLHRSVGEPRFFGTMPVGNLDTTLATAQIDRVGRTVAYSGARVAIVPAFAEALNEAFAKPKGQSAVFSGGDPLGTFSYSVQVQ